MKMDRVRVCQRAPTQRASTGIKNVRCHDRDAGKSKEIQVDTTPCGTALCGIRTGHVQ